MPISRQRVTKGSESEIPQLLKAEVLLSFGRCSGVKLYPHFTQSISDAKTRFCFTYPRLGAVYAAVLTPSGARPPGFRKRTSSGKTPTEEADNQQTTAAPYQKISLSRAKIDGGKRGFWRAAGMRWDVGALPRCCAYGDDERRAHR